MAVAPTKRRLAPDAEMTAIRRILAIFESLPQPARRRAFEYIAARSDLFDEPETEPNEG